MKKIDIFILSTFRGHFIGAFFIAFLVLLLQAFWLYINELAGKGLDFIHILTFATYLGAVGVGNALPLAILTACIMTYGKLSETSEIVAMRSMGLSFGRIAMPIGAVSILLCVIAFIFQDYIIPNVNLKLVSLRYDIIAAKPAFSINEGIFYTDLDGFVILIDKKEKDNKNIEDVIIYQEAGKDQDHLMIAKTGIMKKSDVGQGYLTFVLNDGHFYESSKKKEQMSMFKYDTYIKDFPLWQFEANTADSLFTNSLATQNIALLNNTSKKIDTAKIRARKKFDKIYGNNFSLIQKVLMPDAEHITSSDSITSTLQSAILDITSEELNNSDNKLNATIKNKQFYGQSKYLIDELKYLEKRNRLAIVTINKKYILSIICFIFFLVGTPLGSIIKKGGLGLPLVFATITFVAFIFSTTFGERFSRELSGPNPYWAPWVSTIIFAIIGIILFLHILGIGPNYKKLFTFTFKRQ